MAKSDNSMKEPQQHWLDEIGRYQKAFESWKKDNQRFIKRYTLEGQRESNQGISKQGPRDFNIIWSNVQTLKPALFSRTPEIVAERRHRDRDPIGRITSEVIQRSNNSEVENNGFKDCFDQVVLDVLLCARGVPWVRLEGDPMPDVEVQLASAPDGQPAMMTPDGQPGDPQEVREVKGRLIWHREALVNERTMVDYVHWDDFAHSPERNWADVVRRGWVARRTALTRDEGMKRFGKKFENVPMRMTSRTAETLQDRQRSGDKAKYGEVWEIWDAKSRKRIFVAAGGGDVLESSPDPYGVEGFFPCPRPAYGTLSNENLVPVSDIKQIVGLAEELDIITGRIRKLTESLRLVGIYDASAEGLGRALDSTNDGKMVAVSNFSALVGKSTSAGGGLNGVVQWLPMDHVIQTLVGLYEARDRAKTVLYEVSGISDIVRGQVDPREKASQSKLKAGFASQRLDQRRRAVERVARDTARIQVELMCEHYSPDRIREQSGFDYMREIESLEPQMKEQIWGQVIEVLRTDKARGFRVDVETDSTVELDAGMTQESRTEFLQSAGNFLNNALPVMQASPDLAPLMGEMMLFAVRGYRAGRTLESAFEEAVQGIKARLEKQAQAEQQPPPPDPEAEAKAAREQQKMQVEGQKGQIAIQREQQQAEIDAQKGQLELEKEQADIMVAQLRVENERLKIKLNEQRGRQMVQ